MGHVITDRIEDAWRELRVADNYIEAGQTAAGVLKCETALRELFRSADGVGEDAWFAPREQPVRDDISQLKRVATPDAEDVRDLVTDVRRLTKETKEHVEPIINERIEYETYARLS